MSADEAKAQKTLMQHDKAIEAEAKEQLTTAKRGLEHTQLGRVLAQTGTVQPRQISIDVHIMDTVLWNAGSKSFSQKSQCSTN